MKLFPGLGCILTKSDHENTNKGRWSIDVTRTTIFIKDIKSAFLLFLCVKCEQKNQQVNFVSFFSTFFTLEVFLIENIIVDDIFL